MRHIYLDYNATTPIAPMVQEAMLPFLSEHYGNPSSSHSLGRACHEAVEDARAQVAALLGADADEIVFTSCGTESNNLAIKGVMLAGDWRRGGRLVTTQIEHPAIIEPARYLSRLGLDVSFVGCDSRGVVSPEAIEREMQPDTRLVSVMLANNETGVIQPVREIAEICQARGVLLHTDASQAVGKIRTYVDELGVDLLTIAGHKLYAPKGVGALYVRQGVTLEPVLHGAGHEGGLRAGTENTAYIAALGKASFLAARSIDGAADRLASLRDRLYHRLREGVGEGLTINGDKAPRLPNTLNVNFPGVRGGDLLARTPEICASTGAACHSGSLSLSATLTAMGVPPEVGQGAVRFSVGWYTSEEAIDAASQAILGAWESLHDLAQGKAG